MALTIALFFFSFVLLGISIGFYIWWKKYGKELFNLIKNNPINQNLSQNMKNLPDLSQNMKNLPDLSDQMRIISEIMTKNFKK